MDTWYRSQRRVRVGRPRRSYRPEVEPLEARQLLSAGNLGATGADDRFVGKLYEDLLNRSADAAGRSYWDGFLKQGVSHAQLVLGIEASTEYQKASVKDLFQTYLKRDADPAGLDYFTKVLAAGASLEDVKVTILASDEYYKSRGNNSDLGFLAALREDLLGDANAQAPVDLQKLLTRGSSRNDVAVTLLDSQPAESREIQQFYQDFLHRPAGAADITYWSGLFGRGAGEQYVIAGILGSAEANNLLQYDAVLDWNATLVQAVRTAQTPAPLAARNMAVVQLAVYDAVNAVDQLHNSYQPEAPTPSDASAQAAAAAAAYRTLVNLYPDQKARFDDALMASLANIKEDVSSVKDGLTFGVTVADAVLAVRSGDKSDGKGVDSTTNSTNSTTNPTPTVNVSQSTPVDLSQALNALGIDPSQVQSSKWQPAPPAKAPEVLPYWGQVTPFAITAAADYAPTGVPFAASGVYAQALTEVTNVGSIDSKVRTADQTQQAKFWSDGAGTSTAPGHWNEIAGQVAALQGNTVADNARLFALLNLALADSGIVAWDVKDQIDLWRPITAIRAGSTANGSTGSTPNSSAASVNSTWTPLLVTPASPSYLSDPATFAGAASSVLDSFFGTDVKFSAGSDALPGVNRSFTGFDAAAQEAAKAGVYGGVEFSFAANDGLKAGKAVAGYVTQHFLT